MNCEQHYRALVTRLLTLAGLHDTVPVDEVMGAGAGIAHRYRRRALPTTAAAPVSLHADAHRALGVTDQCDQATPSWLSSLVTLLDGAANRGSRRAFLTARFLTGGWDATTPHLSRSDRTWLLTAKHVGISIPPTWEAWLTSIRSAAVIGRLLPGVKDAVTLMDILDGLDGIDAVSPQAVQDVSPLRVVQWLFAQALPSSTDLQQVLRAVLVTTPVVRKTVTLLNAMHYHLRDSLPFALIGRAAHAYGQSVERAGSDALLMLLAEWIQDAHSPAITLADLRDPSPRVVEDIIRSWWPSHNPRRIGVSISALIRIWHTGGRDDAAMQLIRSLDQGLADYPDKHVVFWVTVIPMLTGVVRPPYGDTIAARLVTADDEHAWTALAAGAVYATACQSIGHVPTIATIEDGLRDRWIKRRHNDCPSPIPVLTVGQERTLLLPALRAAWSTEAWPHILLDVIDAMDMMDMVGGDPQALQDVLADVLTTRGSTLDPQIIIRLAASRCGQTLLNGILTVPPLPVWTKEDIPWFYHRLIPHLVSPWWATAPPHLRAWWECTFRQVTESRFFPLLSASKPLYPTVFPQAAVLHPTANLVTRAVAGQQWDDLPAADRQACLRTVLQAAARSRSYHIVLDVAMRAATDTARQDVWAALSAERYLPEQDKDRIRQLIDLNPGSQDEL